LFFAPPLRRACLDAGSAADASASRAERLIGAASSADPASALFRRSRRANSRAAEAVLLSALSPRLGAVASEPCVSHAARHASSSLSGASSKVPSPFSPLGFSPPPPAASRTSDADSVDTKTLRFVRKASSAPAPDRCLESATTFFLFSRFMTAAVVWFCSSGTVSSAASISCVRNPMRFLLALALAAATLEGDGRGDFAGEGFARRFVNTSLTAAPPTFTRTFFDFVPCFDRGRGGDGRALG
jgi:hypothetical protein